MLIRLFRYPILFILLWNLVPGMAELSHGGAHQEVSQTENLAISTVGLQTESSKPNQELPCETNCDDENCLDHQCHFGHCQILRTVTLGLAIPGQTETLFPHVLTSPIQEIPFSLFKPPAVSFLS